MLKQDRPPSVFWDDNGSFSDGSQKALDYSRDAFALTSLSATEDYLYFGLYKPFSGVYVEVGVANAAAKTFTAQYYDGTTWTALSGVLDDTLGFSRSGFLRFTKPSDWDNTTINSVDKFWIRLRPSANFDSGCTLQGMNIVYSDDQDLKSEVPEILRHIYSGETTYILRHQAARDDIIQDIRNSGKYKQNATDGLVYQVDVWDILDIEEVKQWSKYLALSKIYYNIFTEENDAYHLRAKYFENKAKDAAKLYYATLDLDDDGIKDIDERLGTNFSSGRLVRS